MPNIINNYIKLMNSSDNIIYQWILNVITAQEKSQRDLLIKCKTPRIAAYSFIFRDNWINSKYFIKRMKTVSKLSLIVNTFIYNFFFLSETSQHCELNLAKPKPKNLSFTLFSYETITLNNPRMLNQKSIWLIMDSVWLFISIC